jgi:hypothetical protein
LRWSEFRIFENAQSVTLGRQFEEILIFPHEIQQNVTRVNAKQKEKKEDAFSDNAYCQEHRHKSESTNACSGQGKDTAGPVEQEQLEPGISNFVNQQDSQRFRGADQKAERFCFVSNDELTMRHIRLGERAKLNKLRICYNTNKFNKKQNFADFILITPIKHIV